MNSSQLERIVMKAIVSKKQMTGQLYEAHTISTVGISRKMWYSFVKIVTDIFVSIRIFVLGACEQALEFFRMLTSVEYVTSFSPK